MFRKLIFLLLAAVLAWFLGPSLSSLFTGGVSLAGKMPGGVGEYFTNRDGDFYFHFLLWLVILWFLLPIFFSLFNVLAPQARRYGTTKLLRRIHGVTAELVILGGIFVILTMVFGFFAKSEGREIKRYIKANSPLESLSEASNRLAKIEGKCLKVSLPLIDVMRINEKELTNYLNDLSQYISIPADCYYFRLDHYDYLSSEIKNYNENVSTRKRIFPLRVISSLPPPTRYANLRSNYTKALEKKVAASWEEVDAVAQLRLDIERFESVKQEAETKVSGLNWLQKHLMLPLRNVWPYSLIVAGLFWLVAHVLWKAEISAIHHVFMRFIDEGRFGLGGSGRFAGLIEEWGLLSGYQQPGAILSMCLSPFNKQHLGQRFGQWLETKQRTPAAVKRTELFLGRSLYNPFLNIGMSGDQHMLTIAGSRTGKGATAIIPNLLLWEGSAIVIDPKGTNAAVTAERRRQMGQKVHLVDPFGIVEKNEEARACFNPLEGLNPDSDTIREDIGVIADALVVPDPESKEKHWDDGARTILSGLIGQLITGYENPSLPLLRELLALPQDKQDELWATMFLNPGAANAPRDAASRIIRGAGTNEISGLISNADKHTEWLSYTAMQKTLSRSTFSFAELKEQPTTIYLILPPNYLGLHNRFLRLFINMAILQMAAGGRSKIPVLMVMDEFLALGHMAEVEKALGLMAGYNLILWPIVQDLARLRDLYKNSVNSFIANSRAVQVFGVADPATTEYISKQLGNSAASILPTGKFSNFVPLRSPDEVAKDIERDSNRQYILRAGKPPLVLEKVPYYNGGLFGGAYPGLFYDKYTPDPDHGS